MKTSILSTSIRCLAAGAALALAAQAIAQQPAAPAAGPKAAATPQEPVAKLKALKGNVLVSRESALVAGTEAMPLVPGTRIITTALSEVTVAYDDGCDVKLKENQRFEVETGKPCAALVAQSTVAPPPSAAVGLPLVGLLVPAGAAAGGIAAIRDARDSRNVSPN